MPEVTTLKGVVAKIKDNVSPSADAIYTDESRFYGTVPGCIKNHDLPDRHSARMSAEEKSSHGPDQTFLA
jgi:hypothetical protein